MPVCQSEFASPDPFLKTDRLANWQRLANQNIERRLKINFFYILVCQSLPVCQSIGFQEGLGTGKFRLANWQILVLSNFRPIFYDFCSKPYIFKSLFREKSSFSMKNDDFSRKSEGNIYGLEQKSFKKRPKINTNS